ncbi:hypothetical protein [Okeania sp. SIO1I7]|uniref:hypothetical protein n=1 Tax=Okeania sp. SIO1I7 TaxID=2607772 RepID=UPI0013FAB4A2|nr:hypothetical protein [Okeania sp. SIO1I7]NET28516.1 hypothetical protein [Okeania sp. SIO1I7]
MIVVEMLKEEGRRKKEEGNIFHCLSFKLLICSRLQKEEGRRKKEEENIFHCLSFKLLICSRLQKEEERRKHLSLLEFYSVFHISKVHQSRARCPHYKNFTILICTSFT